MDVVSDAISAVRLGHPSSERVRKSCSWCTRLDPFGGAGFHVVLKGGCRLLPDDGAPVSLGVGDAVLLPHGTGHVLTERPQRGETEILCGRYRLDCSRIHPLLAEMPQVVHLPSRVGGHRELRAAIDLLAGELDERLPGACVALPHLLDLLLVYMIRAWMTEATSGAWPRVLGDPVTAGALRALHSDPAAPWTTERLAAEVNVSRPTLARRFTTLVGRPPMAYLTWWRIILTATLLRDTSETLASIAGRVGYGSPYALSHAFQREFGTTPGRYRKAAREASAPPPHAEIGP
ncbi:AraC family transcriptional regulator [Actinoallomurus iriomotensis]|uniref:AraC family transcriptional regulator n=1 Tax=Actinoallomurus iriomotensis TaxID=478107 RepID=A0A9W6S3X3_9ACTN|nr:AraC family transcriptional regulator [Actinoallomurus iriomotensis]GLY86733.1 AraC family transcriptional regulator [Actinoallomurus iriomotensis]